MLHQGINSLNVKQINRGLVLRQIALSERPSRTSITRSIGLTKMAVSNIVSELIEQHYIAESKTISGQKNGRNPVMLKLSDDAPLAAGIYLSRDAISGLITDLKLGVLLEKQIKLENESAESLEKKLVIMTGDLLSYRPGKILGIGLSVIGPLDRKAGAVINPRNFFGIHYFPVAVLLQKLSRLPVIIHNDMKAAALAELLYGKHKCSDFIYLGLTNGVGSGIITDSRLFSEENDATGEIGHLSVDPNGPLCSCGRRGCLELYAGIPILLKQLKQACGISDLTAEQLHSLPDTPSADAVFMHMIEKLAAAMTDFVNIIGSHTILVGHEGSYLPPKYLKLLEDEINSHIFSVKKVEVRPAHFGVRAPLLGSACCILDALFSGSLPLL